MRTKTAYSLLTWALLLIALLAPQQAKADAVKDAYKYTINLGGANIIAFRMPVKDDARVTDGKITYTIEGSDQTYTCLTWRAITDSEWKDKTGDDVPKNYHAMEIVLEQPTLYTITPGINYVLEYVGGDANKSHGIWTQKQGGEDEYWVKVEWVVPSDMRGKTVKFHWDVELSSGSVKDLQDVTISVPDPPAIVDPTLTQPVLSQDEKGKIGYAWYIATQNVKKAEAFYKLSADDTMERHMLLGNEANGTALLDATIPHYHFYIKVDYYDSFDYLIANRMSDIEDVPMLHAPRHFQAKPEDDGQGSVMLTWDTDHPDYPDIFEMDFFEIQRSLTGREEDFETLTSVIYETGLTHYEYKDSTYLAALTQDHLSAEGYLPPTKYRIRRSSSSIWGWQGNPAAATSTVIRHSQLLLYVPTNSQATWADSTAYTVKVNWDYLPSFVESEDTETIPTDITGSGTEADPYVIHDADGWNTFARWIENDNDTYANKHYLLDSDINVMTMVGLSEDKAFKGTFDGNGHTITVDFDGIESYLAPFRYTNGATIRQLHVSGTTIISAKCAAGLIGRSKSSTVENCQVEVNINSTVNGDGTHGGLIAYVDQGTTTINNCLFNGSLIGSGTYNCGGFVGWTEGNNNAKVNISNCLFAPVQVTVKKPGNTFARTRKTSDVTITNCYYTQPLGTEEGTNASGKTNDELLASLGNGWAIKNGMLEPVMPTYTEEPEFVTPTEGQYWYGWDERAKMTLRIKQYNRVGEHISTWDIELTTSEVKEKTMTVQLSRSCVTHDIELLVNKGTSPLSTVVTSGTPPVVTNTPLSLDTLVYMVTIPSHGFLFESSGKVSKKVIAETHQSSVGLTWDTDGNVIDFFQVLRKYKDEPDSEYKVIATDLTGLSYEDETVSPLETYMYKVRSAVDCEGLHFEESDPVEGACKHTGMVTGRVQFPDGTGLAGVKVNIASQDKKVSVEVTTDDEGYFEADELSYQGKTTATYIITPVSKNQLSLEIDSYSVTFNDHTNFYEVKAFVVTSGQRFSGYVMYDGTSIPVKGAGFTVNGHQVKNVSGKPVETDFEGKFSFYVNSGKNVIQAVMDGHSFTNNGYFKSSSGVDFSEAIDNIYFYDETTVKLVGRIVGGDTQGSLPLDNNLSHNNLGTGVKMVLTLEGDNTSWLVYDNQKPEVSVRDYTVPHEANDPKREYFTKVHTTRKRIEVSPDSLTGEYRLNLPPVRWKVQQIYSDGYPTLFQEGMVSEVIDLTDCLASHTENVEGTFTTAAGQELKNGVTTTYNAKYNRIYHAPVELVYKQKTYDSFDYLGDKFYKLKNVDGTSTKVPLATADATAPGGVKYTFGHPVFSLNIKYPLLLSAVERYYWNNDQTSLNIDVVKVGGGKVTIQNGLKITDNRKVVELDENGEALTNLEADQTPWLLTGDDALRTVTMTLEQDGTNYEAKPIKGYVLNIFAMADSKDILSVSQPTLIDILRDPPGGGSYATLEKGSTLKLSYTLDMKYKGGLNLTYVSGTKLANFTGLVTAPYGVGSTYGLNNNADTETVLDFEYAISGEKGRAFAYTMNVAQDIKTSSDINMVGANADLYIGMVQNLVVTPASTIRAIPDHIFKQMEGQLGGYTLPDGSTQKYGSLVEIASGVAANDTLYHLVRDESLMVGPKVESTFIHSQKYIITQLLPSLVEKCRSLMFIGTAAEAQQRANATGKAVYRSLLPADDDAFAVMNVKNGEPFYYTSSMPQENNMSYVIHIPAGRSETEFPDEVAQNCSNIQSWVAMIAQNEQEKLNAFELVRNYDVDGGSSINYSESFSSEYNISNYMHLPGFISGSFFDETGADMGFAAASIIGIKVANKFIKMLWDKMSTTAQADGVENDKNFTCRVHFTGKTFEFRILPVLDFDVKDVSYESKIFNRKESFHIGLNSKSHLDFDVYRVKTSTDEITSAGLFDVFTGQNFYDCVDYVDDYIDRDIDMSKCIYARSFVYRTRGGATACPWENERKTLFYRKGTTLDERTKKIENPKIKLDKQSVSGVAYGEPARFVIYLTNESEQPEAATGGLAYYNLYMKETTNPNGAKLMIDGMPLDGQGRIINLVPGTITQKTLEVFAGEDYDYEGLTIGVMSQEDMVNVWDEVSFDVHYLRTAGNVEISSPSDKWVMNTDAEYNDKRGYFIPVVISGFNKHQKNFDHIEFQYKETARGDDFWTNLCSYYADSTLMASANGVKQMIPENGNITTQFYGEGVVMEKAYDLRAVLYCRNGNSFLTTSSKVMSGVKDTRRPQLFGTPEPMNGILGAGENIVFNFSEDIEYNYLSAITNFEVKGEVNNDAVTNDISLQFEGGGGAQTEAERNFADKDITIDMMIHPDKTGKDMPLFAHGSDGKKLQLWITNEGKLKAKVNDNEYLSAQTIDMGSFTQVALVIHQPAEGSDRCRLEFYNGGEQIGSHQMEEAYTGTGIIMFGSTNEANPRSRSYYSGRMMEARLWYRALSGGQIGTTYGNKRLTGYEKGLMDYWPMNDGQGHFIVDKAQGATLQTSNGVGWAKPGGMSLHIDFADKGLALDPMAINRTSEQDYTLMFWFKTDSNGRGALICNGSGHAEDEGAENQFFIGFESDQLKYRSNGTEVLIPGYWSDNDWHHYAMTVNRAMNVVNIYVDQVLRASIEPEGLGGISGDRLMLGNCVYERMEGGKVKTFDSANYLQGNLDEICLFDQALPLTLIKSFSSHSPQGDEAGLITYLGFQRQERSKDNDLETQPYVYSKKIYTDDEGGVIYERDPLTQEPTTTPQRDYLFTASADVILSHIDQAEGAPVLPEQELHNLNFSFVGRDHSILMNIKNADEKINKRNIYVTMREIPDKNGNAMASAATACFFVDRNPLRWKQKTVLMEQDYGQESTFNVAIQNNSQESHTYTIDSYPKWLTVSPRTNTISPTEEQWITFKVNKDLNVGRFDEIIYLTDENGLSEPIVLSLKVNGNLPEWTKGVDRALRQHSMNITARVQLNNEIDTEPEDIVGVFDTEGVCHGVSNISFSEETGESFAFITVYDSLTTERPLSFRLWNHSIGKEQLLVARDDDNQKNVTINFSPSKVVGTPAKPLLLVGGDQYIQSIALYKGWNWVSFNVLSNELEDFHTLLDRLPLHEGDIMTDNVSGAVLVYTNGHWMTSDNSQNPRINHKHAYFFKVQNDVDIHVSGTLIKQKMDRTISLGGGWNSIGYTPMLNLTVQTALTDYNNKANDGDVIKSHDEYAIFTEVNGVGQWKGSLKYMKPGEGYMLYRTSGNEAEFSYPFYEPTSTFLDEVSAAPRTVQGSSPLTIHSKSNMSLTARVEGIELMPGDRLAAYADGERCGLASADSSVESEGDENIFYLSVAGDKDTPIWFAIEREGEIIATTSELMMFKANAVIGKPLQPTAISFTNIIPVTEGWYTVSGIKLGSKPTQQGVYIHNGNKVVIK